MPIITSYSSSNSSNTMLRTKKAIPQLIKLQEKPMVAILSNSSRSITITTTSNRLTISNSSSKTLTQKVITTSNSNNSNITMQMAQSSK